MLKFLHALKWNLCVCYSFFNCDSICLGSHLLSVLFFFGLLSLYLVCSLRPPYSQPHLCNQLIYLSPVSHLLWNRPKLCFPLVLLMVRFLTLISESWLCVCFIFIFCQRHFLFIYTIGMHVCRVKKS